MVMCVQLRICLGRRESIDGRNLEGIRYAFTSFELGIATADSGEDAMQEMAGEINKIRRPLFLRSATWLMALKLVAGDQLKEKSRSWLSPPDPSPNYNSGCEIHQDGTATWFLQGSLFNLWNEKGSLLWIYGKRTFPI
jgi:hypothetical protein